MNTANLLEIVVDNFNVTVSLFSEDGKTYYDIVRAIEHDENDKPYEIAAVELAAFEDAHGVWLGPAVAKAIEAAKADAL